MKTLLNNRPSKAILLFIVFASLISACKKDDPTPEEPHNDEEVITTFRLKITDSTNNTNKTYFFKDPDGDGGQSPYYGPDAGSQTDSVIQLSANAVYFVEIELLDETKSPAETISTEVNNEGQDHMLFYNNGANTIINSGNPYTIKLNDSSLEIRYTDLDSGTPQRGIGLKTRWKTSGTGKFPLNITLRHQPGVKDGSYSPGDSDISVNFKYNIQ